MITETIDSDLHRTFASQREPGEGNPDLDEELDAEELDDLDEEEKEPTPSTEKRI